MTRDQAITQAVQAADRAKNLADTADKAARGAGFGSAAHLAAASRTWADASRAYTALAALLPASEEN